MSSIRRFLDNQVDIALRCLSALRVVLLHILALSGLVLVIWSIFLPPSEARFFFIGFPFALAFATLSFLFYKPDPNRKDKTHYWAPLGRQYDRIRDATAQEVENKGQVGGWRKWQHEKWRLLWCVAYWVLFCAVNIADAEKMPQYQKHSSWQEPVWPHILAAWLGFTYLMLIWRVRFDPSRDAEGNKNAHSELEVFVFPWAQVEAFVYSWRPWQIHFGVCNRRSLLQLTSGALIPGGFGLLIVVCHPWQNTGWGTIAVLVLKVFIALSLTVYFALAWRTWLSYTTERYDRQKRDWWMILGLTSLLIAAFGIRSLAVKQVGTDEPRQIENGKSSSS